LVKLKRTKNCGIFGPPRSYSKIKVCGVLKLELDGIMDQRSKAQAF